MNFGLVLILGVVVAVEAENRVPYIGMPCSNNLDCGVSTTLMTCGSPSGVFVFSCHCQQFLAGTKYQVTHPHFDTNANKCVVKKWDTCKLGRDGSDVFPCQPSTVCAVNKDETDIGTCVSGAHAPHFNFQMGISFAIFTLIVVSSNIFGI